MKYLELLMEEPGKAIAAYLHEGSSSILLASAGVLACFGLALGAHAYFRGRNARFSWRNLAANLGAAAWLLPVAAVFGLYGYWMRPGLSTFDPSVPQNQARVVQVQTFRNSETGSSLPDWALEKETTDGSARFVVVTGEIGATTDEATANARTAAVDLVRGDFTASFPQVAGWQAPTAAGAAAIRRMFVKEIDRKTLSSGTPFRVFQAYNLVELSPQVRRQIFPLWRNEIVGRRIWALGGLAGLLTLTFATLAADFRLDDRTSGLYRRRLKLAAVSVIAAGGLAAVTLL